MRRLFVPLLPLLLLASCWPTRTATAPAGPKVGVVGDSLVVQANDGGALTAALRTGGFQPYVTAHSSYSTANLGTGWGGFLYPHVLVVAVGTNDTIGAWAGTTTIARAQTNLERYLASVRHDCTVIVGVVETPFRHMDVYGDDWNRVAAAHADVFVNWWATAQAHPEYLTSDQTHHTAAGQAAYRAAIVQGVGQCP